VIYRPRKKKKKKNKKKKKKKKNIIPQSLAREAGDTVFFVGWREFCGLKKLHEGEGFEER